MHLFTFNLYTYFSMWGVLLCLNLFLAVFIIFMEKKNYASTWAWVMIVLFIPIIGFIIYLFIGLDMRKRKRFNKKEEEDSYLHLLHRQNHNLNVKEEEFDDPFLKNYQGIIRLNLIGHESLFTTDNAVHLLTDGKEKFNDLFAAIRSAKKSIHLEYYIIRKDFLGKQLLSLLAQKAREGVEVKLLYDGMGCLWTGRDFFSPLLDAGGEACCFFPPFLPYVHLRFNYRNHRKIGVIDGKVGYIGGFNVGKEYIGLDKKMGYWRDTHIRISGPAVQSLDLQFLLDWRFASKKNIDLQSEPYDYPTVPPGEVGIQIVSSGPDSKHSAIRNSYVKMINEAKHSIYLQTPYFIADDGLLTALKIACLSGIDVRIMIPNKPDHMFVYWATYSYIGEVLACGAKCFLYEKGFLHAKTLIIDEEICSVGTSNFDMRSFRLNFEINALIYHEATSKLLVEAFHEDLHDCSELTMERYNSRPLLIHIKESISRLLSPIL